VAAGSVGVSPRGSRPPGPPSWCTTAVHHRGAPDAAHDVVRRIVEQGGRAVTAQADVTDPDACAELAQVGVDRFGRLDTVVGCAGVQPVGDLAELSTRDWRRVLDTNAAAASPPVQAAAERMRGAAARSPWSPRSRAVARPRATPTTRRPKPR
jgi:NAD(P)-dependent dehydrogenase (short-subunit alcohol dehydrogenase family)